MNMIETSDMQTSTAKYIYEVKMNDFCVNHLNVPNIEENEGLKRPGCSVSPINNSNIVLNDCSNTNESYLQMSTNLSVISPFVNKTQPETLQIATKSFVPYLTTSFYDSVLQENVNTSNGIFSTSSPYNLSKKPSKKQNDLSKNIFLKNLNESNSKSIQFQSTPNKVNSNSLLMTVQSNSSKVNFHSILDLAKSDDQKLVNSVNDEIISNAVSVSVLSDNNSSGYASVLCSSENNSNNNSALINYNQHLKFLSMSCNKENTKIDYFSKNKRKPRTQINRQQKEILEYAYNLKGYPDSNEIEYLCNILGFEENVIRIWFQNKRARNKQRQ